MIKRTPLSDYLHQYLACDDVKDYAPNGLQVEGREDIHRICTAVTASEDVILKAANMQADALFVHHGFFWSGEDLTIRGMKRRRIGHLMTHDMNLFAYHLPLDCHAELGNNACIANRLNVGAVKMHRAGKVDNLLWTGTLNKALTPQELSTVLHEKLQQKPLLIPGSDRPISKLAWCSGAAQDFIENAYDLGADAFLSGEISERTYYQARELGIHYFACGHHASERYGIQALGEHLSTRFDLEHHFIDSANPV